MNGKISRQLRHEVVEKSRKKLMTKSAKDDHHEIDKPKHYNQGIECWDYIVSHDMGFLEGNIIKYITRFKNKNGVHDLHKAKAYLDRLINKEEGGPA